MAPSEGRAREGGGMLFNIYAYTRNRLTVKFLSESNDTRYLNSDLAVFSYRYL